MIRTQVQLTEEQVRQLRRAAREQGVSMAEIVRRCIERGIEAETPDRRSGYARAAGLIGKFQDRGKAEDLSEEHDVYLDEAFG